MKDVGLILEIDLSVEIVVSNKIIIKGREVFSHILRKTLYMTDMICAPID